MSDLIQIDRFTRQNQSISGQFSPMSLPRLADYLAGGEGEIHYELHGSLLTDRAGSQKRCIKCIISGWFFLSDPNTLKPVRHELAVESKLILVAGEADLPPLELESDDEDYIVCGKELDVADRVEEEILLDLPASAGWHKPSDAAGSADKASQTAKPAKSATPAFPGNAPGKISPFARLVELKKK